MCLRTRPGTEISGHPHLDGVSPQGPPGEPRTQLREDEDVRGAPWGSLRCGVRCVLPLPPGPGTASAPRVCMRLLGDPV